MHGFEYFKAIDVTLASGATHTTFATIFGAEVINIRLASAATARGFVLQASDTMTTSTFFTVYGDIGAGRPDSTIAISSEASTAKIWDLGHLGVGMKYARLMADATNDSTQAITFYNIR